jgi:multidrug resistance efflux pump
MRKTLVFLAVMLFGAAGIGWSYCRALPMRPTANQSSTLQSPAATAPRVVHGEGRVAAYPGGDVTVSAEMEGRLAKMLIYEKDCVKQGQLLAELASDEYAAALAESKARLAESSAEVNYLTLDRDRVEKLWQVRSASKELLDRTRRELAMAIARRDSWAASIQRNEAILAKTRIVAPIDGVIVSRDADAGEMVRREGTICRIVDLSHVRVEAEIDEFDALRVPTGDHVQITAAGNPGIDWPGTVEEVPDAISQRRLKPQDPARPTDANILLAKIRLDGPTPLKLGQRVELEVQLPAGKQKSDGHASP